MAIEVGRLAPDFTLRDQFNSEVTLSSFRGSRNVVLIFYPYAFTRVCQGELCAVQEDLSSFQNDDVQVLTVSVDTPYAHRVWAEQQGYDFPLLADFWPHGAVSSAYGCFHEGRGCSTRGTYVIDRAGVVRWMVVNAIPDARDQGEYLRVLATL
jgi:mycoredoxin-dependent peroxiredoxin